MVGNKLSEMMAFLSVNNNEVLCSPCAELAAAEAEVRRQRDRERIRQQMELPTLQTQQANVYQPAIYDQEGMTSLRNRPVNDPGSTLATTSHSLLPRRANTQRDHQVSRQR